MIKLSHKVSLAELFDGVDKSGAAARDPDLEKMAFLLCRGGMPADWNATRSFICATGEYAYRRPDDGVIVCPLSALRP